MIITRRFYRGTNWIPETSVIVKIADSWEELTPQWGNNIPSVISNWQEKYGERLRHSQADYLFHGELLAWAGAGWYKLVRINANLEVFQLIGTDLQRYPFDKENPNVENSVVVRLETKPFQMSHGERW